MPNPLDRAEAWLRFLRGLSPNEFADVASLFSANRFNAEQEAYVFFNAWANCDPTSALENLAEVNGSVVLAQTVLTAWAAKDPEAALNWIAVKGEGPASSVFMAGVIRGIAVNDPGRATELMNQMPSSVARARALRYVQEQYLNQGPQAARDWALSLENELMRDGAVVRVAKSLSRTDPKGAADWLLEMPPNVAKRAMADAMERMAIEDSQAAIDYMGAINDPVVKSRALAGIVAHVSKSDPQQAFDLIDANAGLANDEIWKSLYYRTNHENYEIRTNVIARIQNPEVKSNMLTQHLSNWLRSDFEAATHWLDQNEVPAQVREAMEERSKRIIQQQNN